MRGRINSGIISPLAAATLLCLLTACGGETITCAAGTVQKGAACVPATVALVCGAGTRLVEGVCQADAADGGGADACKPDCGSKTCGDNNCGGSCGTCGGDTPICNAAGICEKEPCVKDCAGKICGDDGCGGSCGTCSGKAGQCTASGKCAAVCAPDCKNKVCGDDGCGKACGVCASNKNKLQVCSLQGQCEAMVCLPDCKSKICGPDGCGGTCGKCTTMAKPFCAPGTGQCVAQCIPSCKDKACGDDGCGKPCGTCGSGEKCSKVARCVPKAWTCDIGWFGSGDACDCDCGAVDPDCADASLGVRGCGSLQSCQKGICTDLIPKAWTCSPLSYKAGDQCDCNCGAVDPDCKDPGLLVVGCASKICKNDGTCAACTPKCAGKQCGDDGCGGSCGDCKTGSQTVCAKDQCVDPCKPKPLLCSYNTCGKDGCGGSCGMCDPDATCKLGACVKQQDPGQQVDANSCVGRCGKAAPGGCYCDPSCEKFGNCCGDYVATCKCKPACAGKQCGDDGCGGGCGKCADAKAKYCVAGSCSATCTPKCAGKTCGDDGCGGSCGSCGQGKTCSAFDTCVPDGWFCGAFFYGDGVGCDCGCGAPDVDCKPSSLFTYNCPSGVQCGADGLCKIPAAGGYCTSNKACTKPGQWCVGLYYAGKFKWSGVCGFASTLAKGVGAYCKADVDCATKACLSNVCRKQCSVAGDCLAGEICIGAPVLSKTSGGLQGYAGVCHKPLGSGLPCKKQADCAASKQVCVAEVDPNTLKPMYFCAKPTGGAGFGADCSASACATGLRCAATKTGGMACTRPCPGGAADCPSGWSCGSVVMHNMGTASAADDVKLPVCLK